MNIPSTRAASQSLTASSLTVSGESFMANAGLPNGYPNYAPPFAQLGCVTTTSVTSAVSSSARPIRYGPIFSQIGAGPAPTIQPGYSPIFSFPAVTAGDTEAQTFVNHKALLPRTGSAAVHVAVTGKFAVGKCDMWANVFKAGAGSPSLYAPLYYYSTAI